METVNWAPFAIGVDGVTNSFASFCRLAAGTPFTVTARARSQRRMSRLKLESSWVAVAVIVMRPEIAPRLGA
jgi:hypothetical protein